MTFSCKSFKYLSAVLLLLEMIIERSFAVNCEFFTNSSNITFSTSFTPTFMICSIIIDHFIDSIKWDRD